jgi:Plasmid encoded RepA protein
MSENDERKRTGLRGLPTNKKTALRGLSADERMAGLWGENPGELAYLARVMVQATMPHSQTDEQVFVRQNGDLRLRMVGDPEYGLPYGAYPRLLLAWMTTEAVRTKDPRLELGHSLGSFMGKLGLIPTGGRWGTIAPLRRQVEALCGMSVSAEWRNDQATEFEALRVTKAAHLWWNPKRPEQGALWTSTITLSTDFFMQVVDRPVPVSMDALRALKRSPLALDLYAWLSYRAFRLTKPSVVVPWEALQLQFGAGYADTRQGRFQFKAKLIAALKKVVDVYPDLRVSQTDKGLEILRCLPSVKRRPPL